MIKFNNLAEVNLKEINKHFKDFIKIIESDDKSFFSNRNECFLHNENPSENPIANEFECYVLKNEIIPIVTGLAVSYKYDNGHHDTAHKEAVENVVNSIKLTSQKEVDDLVEIYQNFLKVYEAYQLNNNKGLSGIAQMFGINHYNRDFAQEVFVAISNYKEKLNLDYESVQKEADDKFYNVQKKVFENIIKNTKGSDFFATKNSYYTQYSFQIRDESVNMFCLDNVDLSLKKYFTEADEKNDIEQFKDLTKFQAQHLYEKLGKDFVKKIKSKELKDILQNGNSDLKKLVFKKRVEKTSCNIKNSIGVVLICAVAALGIAGVLHHAGAAISRQISLGQDLVQIESNVEAGAGLSKFTGNAILATQKDGKYFVEIFGIGVKDVGGKPEFCSATYEIEKDLYDKIYKYYDIEYEYGKDGQLISASNNRRKNLEFFGPALSLRAEWDVKEILAEEVTKKAPVNVTWQNAYADAIDVEPEM